MKKVLDKFELYMLGQNQVFFYKGQKYKHQKSKREPPLDPDTLRCIKIDESGSYAGTVFLHWKTVVYIETYVFTEKNVLKICKLGKMNIFGSLNNVLLMNDFIKMMKTKVGLTTNQKICGMMNNKILNI